MKLVALCTVAAACGLFFGPPLGMDGTGAAGVAVVVTFVIYALALAPPRYRRHGDNRMRETLAHKNGRFGLSLPEDPLDEPTPRHDIKRRGV